jgi:hypothetical protein
VQRLGTRENSPSPRVGQAMSSPADGREHDGPLPQCFRVVERRSNDSAGRRSEQLVAARRLSERLIVFERCEGCWICPIPAVRPPAAELLLCCLQDSIAWLAPGGSRFRGVFAVSLARLPRIAGLTVADTSGPARR